MEGINIHGQNINSLRYADDTALIANYRDKLQEIITRVKEESSKAGLDMNVKKTKTMIFSRDPVGKKIDIKVDNETLQQVEKFIYLGMRILEEIITDKEIERRKNISKEKFSSMAKILKSKRLKLATKLKIVKCYTYITYGCEAWTLYQNTFAQREIAELRCFLHKTEYCVKKIVRKTQGSAKKAINISKYP